MGFQSVKDFEGYSAAGTYMFQIRATAANQTKAMQVTEFTIVIFIHYKSRIAVAILDL